MDPNKRYKNYERRKAKAREYYWKHRERDREKKNATNRAYRESHRGEMSEHNSRRLYVGRMYLGMLGTTRRQLERGNHGETE